MVLLLILSMYYNESIICFVAVTVLMAINSIIWLSMLIITNYTISFFARIFVF